MGRGVTKQAERKERGEEREKKSSPATQSSMLLNTADLGMKQCSNAAEKNAMRATAAAVDWLGEASRSRTYSRRAWSKCRLWIVDYRVIGIGVK